MPSGRRLSSAATRCLRLALPLCLIAAALVAGQGLLSVISRTNDPAVARSAVVSLDLGKPGQLVAFPAPASTPEASPAAAAPARIQAVPAPVTSPVAVFNASTVHGLASRAAALLRAKGLVVVAVDNLGGIQKPTLPTVFYAPGQQAQAHTLAALTGARAVTPAPAWIRADGRLVLVVTDSSTISASGPLANP